MFRFALSFSTIYSDPDALVELCYALEPHLMAIESAFGVNDV